MNDQNSKNNNVNGNIYVDDEDYKKYENLIRPKMLNDFIGQTKLKQAIEDKEGDIYAEFYMNIHKKMGLIKFSDKEGGLAEFGDALKKESEKEWKRINDLIDAEYENKKLGE